LGVGLSHLPIYYYCKDDMMLAFLLLRFPILG